MNRRDSLRTLLIGGIGATALTTGAVACKTDVVSEAEPEVSEGYGRTPLEQKHDALVEAQGPYFSEAELTQIAVLCDLILPATPTAGSATEAEVPAFIDFIVRDLPYHQVPVQGGLMWLNAESNRRFEKNFVRCSENEHKQILDDIAYPATELTEQYGPGREFFERFRGLVLSGYYTTRMGIDDLGYEGNMPNLWDGAPEEVLAKHGLSYDPNIAYVDHATRDEPAAWNEDGTLI